MIRSTSSRRPGKVASRATKASEGPRKSRAKGSSKSRRPAGSDDSSARNSAMYSAVRLAWPSFMELQVLAHLLRQGPREARRGRDVVRRRLADAGHRPELAQ